MHPVTYELIGQARRIAKELGQLVQVMLLGEHVQSEAEELVAHGADIVHVFESPLLKYYTTDGYTKVLTDFRQDVAAQSRTSPFYKAFCSIYCQDCTVCYYAVLHATRHTRCQVTTIVSSAD